MVKIFKAFVKVIFALGAIFLVLLFLLWNGYLIEIPTTEEIKDYRLAEASEIYSSDSVLLGKFYKENRKSITREEIPDSLILCLLATEDIRFYQHNGIDLYSLLRAGIKTLIFKEKSGGGSTITQQLVKNHFPRSNYHHSGIFFHKVREWIAALKYERLYTKDQLLVMYLNAVPFGHNNFGIYTASNFYFNKTPKNLNIAEMATLVGMLKGTSIYDPIRNAEQSKDRRNLVLSNMYRNGYLSEIKLNKLLEQDILLANQEHSKITIAPFFLQHLKIRIEEILAADFKYGIIGKDPYTAGLKIYTTINSKIQQHAENALKDHMEQLQQQFNEDWSEARWENEKENLLKLIKLKGYEDYERLKEALNFPQKADENSKRILNEIKKELTTLRAGFTCIKNTGEVLAWVGGRDFNLLQYDHVKSKRQVGSVFKPIVYATAVDQGVNICNYFKNQKQAYTELDDWEPKNASNNYSGEYTMKGALTYSLNVISVKVLFRAGLYDVLNVAQQMGISAEIPQVPSISLGTPDISLYEMVNAYTCFANHGKRVPTKYLNSVHLPSGTVIYEGKPQKTKQVFSEEVAAIMTNMMESVVNTGTGSPLRYEYKLTESIAGKTGTSQNQADGWFIGYTPQFTAGAWVGADNPGIHFKSIKQGSGSRTALPIWAQFAVNLKNDSSCAYLLEGDFKKPSDEALHCLNQAMYRVVEEPEVISTPF